MLLQVTVRMDGREVGNVDQEVSGSAADVEEQVRHTLQRTGRITLETAFTQLARQASAPHCCGHAMKNAGFRTITVRTTCGEVVVPRRRHRCERCGHEAYPADVQLCCGAHRLTKPLAQRVCQLATITSYPQLPAVLADQHGVTVSHETIKGVVHDVGGHLERLRRAEARRGRASAAAVAPVRAPQRMLIEVDGTMYCSNQRDRSRSDAAPPHLAWQQMKVGAVAWQDAEGRWHKQLTWGRESPQEFGAALYRLACQYGYEQAGEKLFAADGADWCWEIQATSFSAATPIVDWYHVSEHAWDAAKRVAADDPDAWAHAALDQLHEGGGSALVNWLEPQHAVARGSRRDALEQLLKYLRPRIERMDYPTYRQRGWPIGSGLIESSCRQLVGLRLKGPGMHWSEHGALAITALKATHLNGHWHSFWNNLTLAN